MVNRKKKSARRSASDSRMPHTLISFAIGVSVGALTMVVLQVGVPKPDFGKEIRGLMDQSKQSEALNNQEQASSADPGSSEQPNIYDFYTVLPEVEVLIPEDYREIAAKPPGTDGQEQTSDETDTPKTELAIVNPDSATSTPSPEPATSSEIHFILQAASFKRQSDAEQLRARLALSGLTSNIQKVTIQDRGDFYRVRLGPFSVYEEMENADKVLKEEGIKPLRLKVSKSN
ncbi:MAG: hypothetical protein F4X92_11700 [Gammaproteobacteria bacterium]|nr:hypothetical protein [Gammaproteobacteria bacterium]